jgi:hypothetical protein
MPFFVGVKDFCIGIPNAALMVVVLGEGLWIIAYILIIWKGFKTQSYGIPLAAIAMNYTWEFLYAFVWPSSCNIVRDLRYGWFVLDSIIVLQLFLYGQKEQNNPDLRKHFVPCVIAIFLLALAGHWTFHHAYQDAGGEQAAYSINFIMSLLFVFTASMRHGAHGLSYGAAWAKMFGTGVLSLASALSYKTSPTQIEPFMLYLFASIFIFDILYIHVLRKKLHEPVDTVLAA